MVGLRVVIQGFGSVGSWTARIIQQAGVRVMAISDVQGGVYNPLGLDIPALVEHVKQGGKAGGFTGGEPVSNSDLLELECDVLIPAAVENAINVENAPRLKTRVILEAANHPTTYEGDQIINDRGILLLPDILVNAGGVNVSYFEWTQNLQEFHWEEDRVNEELTKIMVRAYGEVHEKSTAQGINHR